MHKSLVAVFVFFISVGLYSQTENLLDDLRQHNLTKINSSLLNPTFSYDRNNPRSIALWTRWQWQTPDTDPTTIFLNYTQQLGSQASGGIGFFQNNTPLFQNTGGIVNFTFSIPLDQEGQSNLYFGSNFSLFQQQAINDSIAATVGDSFVGQFTPGLRIQAGAFNLALAVENALNFNFSDSQRDASGRIFGSLMSYDFPIFFSGEDAIIRPQAYVRSIPDADLQYGLNVLFDTSSFWAQGGYNSFYGASGGLGVTLFKKLSIGGLVEFGLDEVIRDEDPTFELVASYQFGSSQSQPPNIEDIEEEEGEPKLSKREQRRLERERIEQERLREIARQDSIQQIQENQRWEEWNQRNNDSIAKADEDRRLEELRKDQADSVAKAREEQIRKELEKARQDSIARVEAQRKEEQPKPNERYQEVSSAEGLEPGYYLIANVFGTKRYYEAFMTKLNAQGLEPKSFYRSVNKFNYVYLGRYNTLGEARAARNSRLNGRYSGELWVFRVR